MKNDVPDGMGSIDSEAVDGDTYGRGAMGLQYSGNGSTVEDCAHCVHCDECTKEAPVSYFDFSHVDRSHLPDCIAPHDLRTLPGIDFSSVRTAVDRQIDQFDLSGSESLGTQVDTCHHAEDPFAPSDTFTVRHVNQDIGLTIKDSTWLNIIQRFDTPELAPLLEAQILNYLFAVEKLERDRYGMERSEADLSKEFAMLWFKLKQFIYSRDQRVSDLNSPEINEAKEVKLEFYPLGVPKLFICLDGRVLSKFFAGLNGNALRTPAGDSSDFVPKRQGRGLFLRDGDFTRMIDQSLKEKGVVFEVFDSHIGCAARGLKAEKKAGVPLADNGLRQDILRKKEMAAALTQYVKNKYGDRSDRKVVSVQTSFDPHSAYMYLGLDKDECLNDPLVKEQGYTPDILKRLIAECKILSTQDIVDFSENFVLRDAFKQHYFALDYEKDYKASTLNFWRNINSMSHSLIPVLEDMLVKIYPDLAGEEMSPKRIQLAGLVLSNAYNAYLLNHATDGSKKAYAYEHHDESVIAVTWSENGPFDRARAFSVHPNDPQLSGSMDLMKELIRKNRLGGRMSETEKHAVAQMYHRPADYVKNPVPVMLFERLDTTPSQELIDRMREVDWSDLADTNWMTMSDEQFEGYLDSKLPHIPASVVRKINTMRMRAIKAHKPGLPATEAFLDGRLVPIWLLTDQNRSTIAMFPFITKGYDEDATVN